MNASFIRLMNLLYLMNHYLIKYFVIVLRVSIIVTVLKLYFKVHKNGVVHRDLKP